MAKSNIIIRKLNLNDNLEQVAELIYKTDPYIYPIWFKNYDSWEDVLIELIKTEGSVFNYKNIVVAISETNIVGILVYLDSKSNLFFDYKKYIKINRYFKYTILKYIIHLKDNIKDGVVYIPNICVNEGYRKLNIGTRLIEFIKNKNKDKSLGLHCLKKNIPALKLYHKTNFKVIKELRGFNLPYKIPPKIYEMKYLKQSEDI